MKDAKRISIPLRTPLHIFSNINERKILMHELAESMHHTSCAEITNGPE